MYLYRVATPGYIWKEAPLHVGWSFMCKHKLNMSTDSSDCFQLIKCMLKSNMTINDAYNLLSHSGMLTCWTKACTEGLIVSSVLLTHASNLCQGPTVQPTSSQCLTFLEDSEDSWWGELQSTFILHDLHTRLSGLRPCLDLPAAKQEGAQGFCLTLRINKTLIHELVHECFFWVT